MYSIEQYLSSCYHVSTQTVQANVSNLERLRERQ